MNFLAEKRLYQRIYKIFFYLISFVLSNNHSKNHKQNIKKFKPEKKQKFVNSTKCHKVVKTDLLCFSEHIIFLECQKICRKGEISCL